MTPMPIRMAPRTRIVARRACEAWIYTFGADEKVRQAIDILGVDRSREPATLAAVQNFPKEPPEPLYEAISRDAPVYVPHVRGVDAWARAGLRIETPA